MRVRDLAQSLDRGAAGRSMHELVCEAYPICRSITGDGIRRTLRLVQRRIPLSIHEVPSGTPVLDWTVPNEWNIRDAYIADSSGRRVVDFHASNLHVVGYSVPVRAVMRLAELRPHLHTLPNQPDLIPYRTSYYAESWGFCLSQRQLDALKDDDYEVCIESSLAAGHLSYGELVLPGRTAEEVLVSCHACHPSLCNDNLSGIAVATSLAELLAGVERRYSYRFLFIPGTIGSLTWLARNETTVRRLRHGLVLTCLGDAGPSTYKRSRRGDAEIDRAAAEVLQHDGSPSRIVDFTPFGYDERQYCSPGYDLPVGCLMRTPHGEFPEYHTSADNPEFVRAEALADSLAKCLSIFSVLEENRTYVNLNPRGEPQLGRRGLYRVMGGQPSLEGLQFAMLWVLNQSDGAHSLLDIAGRSRLPFELVRQAADLLLEHELLADRDREET